MAQVWAACFDLLSDVVEDGGVWCCVRFVLFRGLSCGGVRFGLLFIIATSSYMT
jgi:hypothetical protein